LLLLLWAAISIQTAVGRPFTVVEEIGLAHFGDPYTGQAEALQFSPDGKYFAALTERGRLDLNRLEDTLRIYRVQDVLSVLGRAEGAEPPAPLWAFNRSTDKDGHLITHWKWLRDSSGIAFLERGANGTNRLMLADIEPKTVARLTPEGEAVKAFDARDRTHYVYAIGDPGLIERAAVEAKAAAIVGTGRSLTDLLFPVDKNPYVASWVDRSQLWAVVGGKPFRVKDTASGKFVVLFAEGQLNLALSPDGQSLVTALAVAEIPLAWEKLYPPPFEASSLRLHAGGQDLATFDGNQLVSRYVHIDLRGGTVRSLSDAPTSVAAGWGTEANPVWSEDGNTIGLPGVFVASDTKAASRACVAVVHLNPVTISCVELIQGPDKSGGYSEDSQFVEQIRFTDKGGQRLVVSYTKLDDSHATSEYRQTSDGSWVVAQQTIGADRAVGGGLKVTVTQGLNDPPVLTATDLNTKVSRRVWDPNTQLKDIALGQASVYKWKDKGGRDWKGGLFKPVPYETGHRYPLVIQTHGFSETKFEPSGVYPTAFAARALAGAGLAVLQVQDCPIYSTPEEGPCNVAGYESAVSQLVKEGLVDPDRIGIIGFSRTCFYVMQALVTSSLHIRAASITDGVMIGYLQYLTFVDTAGNAEGYDYDSIVGARPFGEGLKQWLQHAPLFNMEDVSAALLVVAEGRPDLPFMWEPYAAMRYLHKPVDLILLNNDEHVLSNPAARMVSQGGSVDWFRFWLQDYEDKDPAKAEQYTRWRELRKLHAQHYNDQPRGN
jgi:dipeptidyl aminopeptidase/acylaminoacyl peptidase